MLQITCIFQLANLTIRDSVLPFSSVNHSCQVLYLLWLELHIYHHSHRAVNMDCLYRVGAGGMTGRKFVASLSLGRLEEENFHRLEEVKLITHMKY